MNLLSMSLEALLNICVNYAEIALILFGFYLLMVFWIPKANGIDGYKSRLFLLSLFSIGAGSGIPGAIHALASSDVDALKIIATFLSLMLIVVSVILSVIVFILPAYFAVRVNPKKNMPAIVVLNLLGIVNPITWWIAFIWSCNPEKIETTRLSG